MEPFCLCQYLVMSWSVAPHPAAWCGW